MYKPILIATDGSDIVQKAVRQGLALAWELDAAVRAVHVTPAWSKAAIGGVIVALPPEKLRQDGEDAGRAILAEVAEELAAGKPCQTLGVSGRLPAGASWRRPAASTRA